MYSTIIETPWNFVVLTLIKKTWNLNLFIFYFCIYDLTPNSNISDSDTNQMIMLQQRLDNDIIPKVKTTAAHARRFMDNMINMT